MDLAINVAASLTPQERQMVIKEAIHKFPNVWEVTKSQVSYPKGSIHEHPIPTNPKNPEWYVKAYRATRVQGNKNSYMIMLMIYISMAS